MHVLLLASIAAIAMVIQDILGIVLLLAATRNRGWLAGVMDSAQWLVGITTTSISVTVLQGHSLGAKVFVILLVSAANLFGTKWGESIGAKYVKDQTLEQRLSNVEEYIKDNNHA